jgi:ribosomal protein S19E (S16A)
MGRHKIVDGVQVDYSPEEESAKNAEEKEWADGKARRDVMREIKRLEGTVTQRRIREMVTDAGKKWMEDIEAKIATERGKL